MREHDPSFRPGTVGLIVIDAFARPTLKQLDRRCAHEIWECAGCLSIDELLYSLLKRLIHSRRQFVTFNKKRMPPLGTQILQQRDAHLEFDDRSAFFAVFVCEFALALENVNFIYPPAASEQRQSFFNLVRMKVLMGENSYTCLLMELGRWLLVHVCAREPINKSEAQNHERPTINLPLTPAAALWAVSGGR